jgi:hypothetical protein
MQEYTNKNILFHLSHTLFKCELIRWSDSNYQDSFYLPFSWNFRLSEIFFLLKIEYLIKIETNIAHYIKAK